MLSEVANLQVARFRALAAERLELAREHFHQRRFTCAIATEQRDATARSNRHADAIEHDALAIAHRLILQREQRTRQFLRRQECELELRVDVRRRDALHSLQRFDTALSLLGFTG